MEYSDFTPHALDAYIQALLNGPETELNALVSEEGSYDYLPHGFSAAPDFYPQASAHLSTPYYYHHQPYPQQQHVPQPPRQQIQPQAPYPGVTYTPPAVPTASISPPLSSTRTSSLSSCGTPVSLSPPGSARLRASSEYTTPPGFSSQSEGYTDSEQRPRKRARRKFDEDKKRETNKTRANGACLSCQKRKKRCGAACKGNSSVQVSLPFRLRMRDSELFRRGPTEDFTWTRRRWLSTAFDDPKVWEPMTERIIRVTQGMGLELELVVKQFKPRQDDKDTYYWETNGVRREWKMPPFAVADIDRAQQSLEGYVSTNMQRYIESKVGRAHVIPWQTFQLAVRMSEAGGHTLLRNTLKLFVASRIIEEPWSIVGPDTLDQQPGRGPGPYEGKVPVTPVMDFQIDNITIHHLLLDLRSKILRELQEKVLRGNKPKDVVEIYLTIFILLYNIELTIAHDRWFAKRWNVGTRFSNYPLIDKVFQGANILLAFFHGGAAHGATALMSQDWRLPETQKRVGINEDQAQSMATIVRTARMQYQSMRILKERNLYEDNMYWCSQLFQEDWNTVASPCA